MNSGTSLDAFCACLCLLSSSSIWLNVAALAQEVDQLITGLADDILQELVCFEHTWHNGHKLETKITASLTGFWFHVNTFTTFARGVLVLVLKLKRCFFLVWTARNRDLEMMMQTAVRPDSYVLPWFVTSLTHCPFQEKKKERQKKSILIQHRMCIL